MRLFLAALLLLALLGSSGCASEYCSCAMQGITVQGARVECFGPDCAASWRVDIVPHLEGACSVDLAFGDGTTTRLEATIHHAVGTCCPG